MMILILPILLSLCGHSAATKADDLSMSLTAFRSRMTDFIRQPDDDQVKIEAIKSLDDFVEDFSDFLDNSDPDDMPKHDVHKHGNTARATSTRKLLQDDSSLSGLRVRSPGGVWFDNSNIGEVNGELALEAVTTTMTGGFRPNYLTFGMGGDRTSFYPIVIKYIGGVDEPPGPIRMSLTRRTIHSWTTTETWIGNFVLRIEHVQGCIYGHWERTDMEGRYAFDTTRTNMVHSIEASREWPYIIIWLRGAIDSYAFWGENCWIEDPNPGAIELTLYGVTLSVQTGYSDVGAGMTSGRFTPESHSFQKDQWTMGAIHAPTNLDSYASCADVMAGGIVRSGLYTLHGGYTVYCDLDGGWTLVMTTSETSAYNWAHAVWTDTETSLDNTPDAAVNADVVSQAFYEFSASETRVCLQKYDFPSDPFGCQSFTHAADTPRNHANGSPPASTQGTTGMLTAELQAVLPGQAWTAMTWHRMGYGQPSVGYGSVRVGFTADNDSSDSYDSQIGFGISSNSWSSGSGYNTYPWAGSPSPAYASLAGQIWVR